MDKGSDDIRQDIDATRASLDDKLNMLEDKASDATDSVREASQKALDMIDIRSQVAERPWAALGVAVAAGYVLGSLGGDDEPSYSRSGRSDSYDQRWSSQPTTTASYTQQSNVDTGPSTTDKIMEKGSDFLSQFDGEIDMLKGAAVTAVTTFIRDAVRDYAPAMGKYIDQELQKRGIGDDSSSSTGARSYNSSSSSGRQVSSSPTQSFDEANKLPNADYDGIGQMNRVGMPPQNNPSDSEYYETYTPGTSSDRPEPPAATPRSMNERAEGETRKYTQ